jgi:predicted alpha/beta superfamily hydrolase
MNKGFTLFTLIGVAFFCINNTSNAQISNEDIIIGKHIKLYSDVLNEERSVLIHLPTGYEISQERYPVLYVLDGGSVPSFSIVTGTVERMAYEAIPNMIVVGIRNTDRDRDMFQMQLENSRTSGGADNFIDFFLKELLPYVDKNYRTENYRILSGTSNSAFFTIYVLLKKPDLFSSYVASSPTLLEWFDDPLYKKFDGHKKKNESLNKTLYLIYGENDYRSIIKAIPKFKKIIEENTPDEFKWKIELIKNEGHVPSNSVFKGLQFVFSGWKYPSEKLKETTFREVYAYYNQLAEKYGLDAKISKMVLLNLGSNLVKKNEINEALEVYQLNIKLYPGNAYAHYYLGLAYEKKGETTLAVKHLEKVLEMIPTWESAKRKVEELSKK